MVQALERMRSDAGFDAASPVEDDFAAMRNRARFQRRGILALNLMSGPGAGKTSLILRTLADLGGRIPLAVLQGGRVDDPALDRLRADGVGARRIDTGTACGLDAAMIERAVDGLDPADGTVLLIENLGNLICPAKRDLGEAHKVLICPLTDGEDKPRKYPEPVAAADLMLVTKTDLLPHLDVAPWRLGANARRVNPHLQVLEVSAVTGRGLEAWYGWLVDGQRFALERRALGGAAV